MTIYDKIREGGEMPTLKENVHYDLKFLRISIKVRTDAFRVMHSLDKHDSCVENNGGGFISSVQCTDCNLYFTDKIDRDGFIHFVRNEFCCKSCRQKREQEKEQAPMNSHEFMTFCITPNAKWKELTVNCYEEMIKVFDRRISAIVERRIKEMNYADFLKTPYWVAISYKVKHNAKFKCCMCGGGNGTLQVHHRTYNTHGRELTNLVDLTCVCNKCHSKHHNK